MPGSPKATLLIEDDQVIFPYIAQAKREPAPQPKDHNVDPPMWLSMHIVATSIKSELLPHAI